MDEVLAKRSADSAEGRRDRQDGRRQGADLQSSCLWRGRKGDTVASEFTVKTVSRPYSDQFPEYETVTVETGWVTLMAGGKKLLDERVESDIEVVLGSLSEGNAAARSSRSSWRRTMASLV